MATDKKENKIDGMGTWVYRQGRMIYKMCSFLDKLEDKKLLRKFEKINDSAHGKDEELFTLLTIAFNEGHNEGYYDLAEQVKDMMHLKLDVLEGKLKDVELRSKA